MPQKIRISPIQNAILRMLEEAGEENLPCICSTLGIAHDNATKREITALEKLGLIQRGNESGLPSLVLTKEGREALAR
jgi:hypothetical protein